MNLLRVYGLLGGCAVIATSVAVWMRTHRKTPEQREQIRRHLISTTGRITDGTIIDFREYEDGNNTAVQLILYTYDVAGVQYECSQDISSLRALVNLDSFRVGEPASVKYLPHNPENSIVVSEHWTGLRRY